MRTVLICGGAGFIGHHLARKLKSEGHKVIVADIKDRNEYSDDYYDQYERMDLTLESSWQSLNIRYKKFDEVYQLAADTM
jgi:nucleoside-diphosphate-sugar epimerase